MSEVILLDIVVDAVRGRIARTGEAPFTAACIMLTAIRNEFQAAGAPAPHLMSPAAIAWAAENPHKEGEPIFPMPEPMKRPPLHNGTVNAK